MQVLVVCFVLFFGAAELYHWLREVTLPLPVFVAAGALLAIASNSNQWGNTIQRWRSASVQLSPPSSQSEQAAIPATAAHDPAQPSHAPGPQLPNFAPQSPEPISFVIRQPQEPAQPIHRDRTP